MPIKLVIGVETEKERIQRKEFVFDNTKVTDTTCGRKLVWPSFNSLSSRYTLYWCVMDVIQPCFVCFSTEKGGFLPAASANEEQTLRKT